MSGRFRHLARHTLVYGAGSVLQRFVGFLLIPFYTQYLSPADYGVLALAGLLSSASQQIQLLGMPSALTRSVLLTARDDDERRAAIGSAGWAILVQSLVQAVLLALLAVPIAALVFGDRDEARWVWLIACGTPAYAIETFRNTLFRIREESGRYASVTLIAFTLNVGLNIFLVAGAGWGAFGVLAGQVLASLIMATLFLPWLVRALYSVPRPGLLRDMFGYALPLVPAGLCQWMLDLIDRYILRIYRPLDEVGLYSLGYRFGMVLLLFTMAFRIAWPQVVFTQARGDEEEAKRFFARALTYYAVVMGFLGLGLATLGGDLLRLSTPDVFHAAAGIIPLVALAYALQGSAIILEAGIDVRRRTGYIPLLTALAAGINVVLNLLLVPRLGMYGAAWASTLSFLVIPVGFYLVGRRIYPIAFEWLRVAMAAGAAAVLFAAAALVPGREGWGSMATRAAIILLYPVALWWLPFLSPGERALMLRWTRRGQGGAPA